MPAPAQSTFRFSNACRACSAVSSLLLLVTGLRPRIAEKKTNPPAFTPVTMPSMRSGPPAGVGIVSRFIAPPNRSLLAASALRRAGKAEVPHQQRIEALGHDVVLVVRAAALRPPRGLAAHDAERVAHPRERRHRHVRQLVAQDLVE